MKLYPILLFFLLAATAQCTAQLPSSRPMQSFISPGVQKKVVDKKPARQIATSQIQSGLNSNKSMQQLTFRAKPPVNTSVSHPNEKLQPVQVKKQLPSNNITTYKRRKIKHN